ncbi:MAG: 3-oxoacid CoA-transferase subunit A [Bdellovibrionales bacterium]|jgi:acetate CoA/acetoacetate CoA-transferase alpha subunit|nr:3-oxoacid CoA-transferase subunit A [Bdellovibrionales bacterium]
MKAICTPSEIGSFVVDGSSILIGGFLGVGAPHRLIEALVNAGRKNLTIISNDAGRPGEGVGKLISAKAVSKLYASHIGTNPEAQKQMREGTLEVELVPQGTLIERIRSHGFGLGGVLTKTGLGTLVEAPNDGREGKRVIEIGGEKWLLDTPLGADFSFIRSKEADYYGNLNYHFTANNFNAMMAMAGKTVFAEADEIVAVGDLSPDDIDTPGVLVDYVLEARNEYP